MNFKLIIVLIALLSVYLPSSTFASEKLNTIQLHVDGMVSDACPVILQSAVNKIEGVKRVKASLENHSAVIEYDVEKTNLAVIQQTIKEKAGFETTLKKPTM